MRPYYAHVEFDPITRLYFGVILDIPDSHVVAETMSEVSRKLYQIVISLPDDNLPPDFDAAAYEPFDVTEVDPLDYFHD